ncbi:MAG: nitrous oxide reductase accessory protein NosL [Nitrospirae bacterium]|nr:nitrous oxide reductase accessory protein NosL [Nitrospirota bacterium]
MRKIVLLLCIASLLIAAVNDNHPDDLKEYPACLICGMDRQKHLMGRMLLAYDGGSKGGTCSIRCTAVDMAAHREKTITGMMVADYATGKLVDAGKAVWVIGGGRTGIMSRRAKWAFAERTAAEKFIAEHGGKLASYDEAMKTVFSDMAGDVTMPQGRKHAAYSKKNDIQVHPDCKYCGMDRRKFDFSRMLVVQKKGPGETGTCSIHCTAIDLALNYGVPAGFIGAGDYGTKKLINARKAFWVIGGDRQGVMSIRGKWAFEMRKDAEEFVRAHGGAVGSFDVALQAAFEDMWEILK